MKRIIGFLIINLFFIQIGYSQKNLFSSSESESYLIKYTGEEPNSIKNQLIIQIAELVNKNYQSLQYILTYKQISEIVKPNGHIEFQVFLKDINVSGVVQYKGCYIGNALMPKNIDLKLYWLDESNKVLKTYDISNIEVPDYEPYKLFSVSIPDTLTNKNIKLKVLNKVLNYNQKNFDVLKNRIGFINKFYATFNSIDSVINCLSVIPPTPTEMEADGNYQKLNQFDSLVNQCSNYLTYINNQNFITILRPEAALEKRFTNKKNDLITKIELSKNNIAIVYKRLAKLFYQKGINYLSNNDFPNARNMFDETLKREENFAPALYELAVMDLKENQISNAFNHLIKLKSINQDKNLTEKMNESATKIYDALINEASQKNNLKLFDESIELLKKAKQLTAGFQIKNQNQLNTELSKALNGKFKAKIVLIDNLLSGGNLIEAEKEINETKLFCDSFPSDIKSTAEINIRLKRIYYDYISNGDAFTIKKEFEAALAQYAEAERICKVYKNIPCSDELIRGIKNCYQSNYKFLIDNAFSAFYNNQFDEAENILEDAGTFCKNNKLAQDEKAEKLFKDIKQKKYDKFVTDGENYVLNNDFEKAMQCFEEARKIQTQFEIQQASNFQLQYVKTSKQLITNKLDESYTYIQKNDYNKAKEIYSQAIKAQKQYNLLNDIDVVKILVDFDEKHFKTECKKIQNQFDEKIKNATKLIESKEFIKANDLYEEALSLSKKYYFCYLNTTPTKQQQESIKTAVEYQQKVYEANQFIANNQYQNAIDKYNEAGEFYLKQQIINFKIDFVSLYDFILKGNNGMKLQAVEYYTKQNNFDLAIRVLNELRKLNVNKNETKQSQEVLGSLLAKRDKKIDPSANPKIKVLSYTNDDSWFKVLKSAYLDEWNK